MLFKRTAKLTLENKLSLNKILLKIKLFIFETSYLYLLTSSISIFIAKIAGRSDFLVFFFLTTKDNRTFYWLMRKTSFFVKNIVYLSKNQTQINHTAIQWKL